MAVDNIQYLTLSLAAAFQAAQQVYEIARNGKVEQSALEPLLKGLLDAENRPIYEIDPSGQEMQNGLLSLQNNLGYENTRRNGEVARYVIQLLHLERKLGRSKKMRERIYTGLTQARRQQEHFGENHPSTLAGLAETYQQTISTLQPRIMVQGSQGYLNIESNAEMVRALLLTGIFAAVSWRQAGGGRFTLLFKRAAILDCAKKLLKP